MFVELKPLLGTAGEIKLTIRADGDKMKVIVSPTSTDAKAEIALTRPLAMCETAEELDAGFMEAIRSFTATRTSLAEQVTATTTILKAAEQEQAKKAVTRTNVKPGAGKPGAKPAVDVDVSLKDHGDDESDSAPSAEGSSTVTLPASGSSAPKPAPAAASILDELDI